MADIGKSFEELREKFISLPLTQKLLIVGVPILVFSLGVTLLLYSLKPDYAVLYAGMSAEDMNAILTELDREGIPYRVGGDGRTILVPEGSVRELRLKLAAKGMPSKGVIGYEIFDKSGIGLSEFQQRVNFKRAIEGELVRTILRFKNIEDARVHIALPEKSLFVRDSAQTSASVFIKLKPGANIHPEQVKAIRNLVAASVEDLKPENVVIIDDRGRNLTAALGETPDETMTIEQIKIKREMEKDIEKKIQTALEEALGFGNVKVRVSVELDFSKIQKKEEIYDPDMTAVVSEHKKKEKTTGTLVAGVPGTEANVPPGTGAVIGQQGAITERKESVTNYEVSKKEVIAVDKTVRVKRLSVGVIVNKEIEGVDEESIRKIVSAAAGLDTKRGDTLSVVMIPFKKPAVVKPPEEVPPSVWREFLVPIVAGVVLALLAIFGILKLLRRKAPQPVEVGPPPEEIPTIARAEALREHAKELEIVKTITEVARKEPKKVAALLKTWLREE